MNITDHGDLDFLTPNPTEVDQAIAPAIRNHRRPAERKTSDAFKFRLFVTARPPRNLVIC